MNNKHNPVILLIRNAAPGDFGGAETYQVSLAKVLTNEGYTPIIISRSKKLLQAARNESIPTEHGWWWSHQNWSGKWLLIFPVYILWQLLLVLWYLHVIYKLNPAALHIQSKDDFISATIAARLARRKAIWTDHMDLRYIFENVSSPFRNPLGKTVRFAGRFADHIILISKNEMRLVKKQLTQRNPLNSKLLLIHNGVIDKYSIYHTHDSSDENELSFSYCLASRIVKNKGVGEAIEAFSILQKKLSNKLIRLDIYGDGEDLRYFKTIVGKNSSIAFHGHQDDALRCIAKSDVFMLPSYQEGFSIALLEASMLGKAIIASDVDSNPEIISDGLTGLTVPPRNPQSLASAMEQLYTNRSLKQSLESAARRNYLEKYNLEIIVKNKIIPLYAAQN